MEKLTKEEYENQQKVYGNICAQCAKNKDVDKYIEALKQSLELSAIYHSDKSDEYKRAIEKVSDPKYKETLRGILFTHEV